MHPHMRVLRADMDALGGSDHAMINGLCVPSGQVESPFLGEMLAGPFSDRLAGASAKDVITPIDILSSRALPFGHLMGRRR